ncbi:MAG: DUF6455 family protein [Rhodomicrobium sp.]
MIRPVSRSVERQAVRMRQMMDRLDVDPALFVRSRNGDTYAEALSRCLKCIDSGDCLRWLDGYLAGEDGPDFCPNLKIFHPCRKRRRAA